jgi:hypothetical protein
MVCRQPAACFALRFACLLFGLCVFNCIAMANPSFSLSSVVCVCVCTGQVVGTLPCQMTKFLAPLMRERLIELTGSTAALALMAAHAVKAPGGAPPFELSVEADVDRLELLKNTPALQPHVRKLVCSLCVCCELRRRFRF